MGIYEELENSTQAGEPRASSKSAVCLFVMLVACSWLRFRYGGNVFALKPPLGFHPVYSPRPAWWIALYKIRHAIWKIENCLFEKYGHPMRDAWEKSRRA